MAVNHLEPSTSATYSANIRNFTPAATPTDVISITGAANRTIKVLKVVLSATQTTAGMNEWLLVKRSTANTGGTPTAATAVPFDSQNPTATASVVSYGANPSALGTTVGIVDAQKAPAQASTGTTSALLEFNLDHLDASPVVLRGVNDVLALNFNGAAVPAGLAMDCTVYWTEQY